ncbi:NlpC/P60 family protein [Oceanirhabdus seepicola]|uniref:C40 family peptidase n=1 Tax=Oceanirhabdus seepicola TaxID=2828781 RepID=UPI00203274E7
MRGKKIILYLLLIFICFNTLNVFADKETDLKNKIDRLRRNLENNEGNKSEIDNLMNDIEGQLEDLSIEIEKLDFELEKINNEIENNEANINKLEIEINELNQELIEEEKKLEEKKKIYSEQTKFLYTKGISSQLEIIFSSKSWDAFMSNVSFTRKLSDHNKKLFNEITEGMEKIESNKKKSEASKKNIEALVAENIKKRDEIQASRDVQADLVNKAKDKKSQYQETLRAYNIQETNAEREIRAAQRQLAIMKENANKKPIDVGDVSGENIIALASKFLGDPYYWSGTRPYDGTYGSSFDCSGLTQYVYKQFGITTGRTTYDQIDHPNGRYVARADLKRGDLVFFGTKSNPHHVGIYIGNNSYLHAPRTGDVIKVSPMTRRDYLEGRRFLPD